jgi:hypothetical protein
VLKRRDRRQGAKRPPVDLPMALPVLGALAGAGLLGAALWP